MQSLLMATSLMFLMQSATNESPPRRAIELGVTIVGVDESIVIPNDVDSPAEFIMSLHGNPGLRWSEEFRLHTLDNASAKCTTGSIQPVVSGSVSSPFGRRPGDPVAETPPVNRGSFRAEAAAGNARTRSPSNTPTVQMQSVGTTILVKPAIQRDGRLFITVNLDSSRLDAIEKNDNPPDQSPTPQWVTRQWSAKTSIVAKSGQAILFTTSETDAASGVRAQTVLVVISAEVEN